MKTNYYIDQAINYLGREFFKDLSLSFKCVNDNILLVKKENNSIVISYHELSSLFYGLTVVKQRYLENQYEIKLSPRFTSTGLMHDCSRNGALNIAYIKEMILISALMGLNRFMLYTEEVYEIEGEPYFGYFRGKYTKEEIKEIVNYAEGFGIEVIPCIQTLSHLAQVLRWRAYQDIKDSPNTLLVGEDKTYQLIDKMIKTCKENFHTNRIHIGMDEAHDLGLKAFLNNGDVSNKKKMLLEHLNRVVDICQKYDMHPMMWEDMFFKIDSKGKSDWYCFDGLLDEDIKSMIPQDIELIYWDYYHDDIKVYDKMFTASIDTNRNVIFAGAVISWIGFVPNFEKSLLFSSKALESAINHSIKDSFICSWGDEGNECSASSLYPLLAQQCLFNYYGKTSKEELSSLLKAITGYELSSWMKLQLPNALRDELLQFENPSKSFLYQDILLGLFDKRVKDEFVDKYKEYASCLYELANRDEKFNYVFLTAGALCECLSHKVVIGKDIRKAYKDGNKEKLKELLKELDITKSLVEKFLETYKAQWDIENKPFGFEITDGRVGFLLQRIKTASIKIKDYVSGKVSSIPELEEEALSYNGYPDDEPHCFNPWSEIVSANKI